MFDNTLKRKRFSFDVGNEKLSSNMLGRLYAAVNTFLTQYNNNIHIFTLIFRSFMFADKNVYLFFDLLAYYILKQGRFTLEVKFVYPEKLDLQSIGFQNTALHRFMLNQSMMKYNDNKKDFIEYYEKNLYLERHWYRKLLSRNVLDQIDTESQITTDVSCFLENCNIPKSTALNTYNVVAELLSNTEHNDGDCILDINICENYINLSFINLFDGRMFDKLKLMYEANELSNTAQTMIRKAINYHRLNYHDLYSEEDFYFISTFQEGVTTKKELSGGTGLTNVIKAIAEEDKDAYSYVLSGSNIMFLRKGLLGDGGINIGFNKSNDYFNDIPSKGVIDRCNLYVPGVVFYLVFKFEVI